MARNLLCKFRKIRTRNRDVPAYECANCFCRPANNDRIATLRRSRRLLLRIASRVSPFLGRRDLFAMPFVEFRGRFRAWLSWFSFARLLV